MKTIEKPEKAQEKTFFSKKALALRFPNREIDATINLMQLNISVFRNIYYVYFFELIYLEINYRFVLL